MKQINHILERLNELIILNEEVENAYVRASKSLVNSHNKTYATERGQEREKIVNLLKIELSKIEKSEANALAIKRKFHLMRLNFRKYFKIENDPGFYVKVYEIEILSINKYDELLSQINLPLSLCRLLLKQRDSLQARLHIIERGEIEALAPVNLD
ncbi:hypothetical protein N1F78_08030 [Seonamhaeicola sp. MEBiC1930]|uniref:hypothetical protein n=1 Tax=Seonamhaeicola sp. MEBiC01930 TaxID=2976768 RepID=UPI00324F15D1